MARSGGVPVSPAVDFPVYGLDMSWSGARWLDSFGDAIGAEVCWVRLAHQRLDTGSIITVETHSRPLTDAHPRRPDESPLHEVAFGASLVMVNLTLPADPAVRPTGLLRALADHAQQRSAAYASWLPLSWQVNGMTVPARADRFAGGWAAFSGAVPGVYLAAAGGLGTDPDGLAFTTLRDGGAYNFDLDGPLHPPAIAASSAARAGGERPPLQRQDWDEDQLRLLHDQ